MRVRADSIDKLTGTEYGDNYTAHWVTEVTGNALITVGYTPPCVLPSCVSNRPIRNGQRILTLTKGRIARVFILWGKFNVTFECVSSG